MREIGVPALTDPATGRGADAPCVLQTLGCFSATFFHRISCSGIYIRDYNTVTLLSESIIVIVWPAQDGARNSKHSLIIDHKLM